jgi:hypothetical protein
MRSKSMPAKKPPKGKGRATDKVGAPPPVAVKGPKPLGVPEGYLAPGTILGGAVIGGRGAAVNVPVAIPPRYFDGDQYLPGGQSPAQIAELQRALKAGGWYSSEAVIVYGRWDPATQTAYANALKTANQSGKSVEEVLLKSAELVTSQGELEEGRKLPDRRITNPDDLFEVFRSVSQDVIGHHVSDEEIGSMILAYQQMELAPQNQQLAAAEAGDLSSQVLTEPPSAEIFAKQLLTKTHPLEAGATATVNTLDQVDAFFRGNR